MVKILETERLVMRRLEPSDLEDLYALYRDPEIRRYFPDGVLSYEQTKEELEWFLNGHPADPRLGLWATILKADGKFVGRCGLLPWTIEGVPEVEIAYMIAKEYWRQGLGSEAARALVRYGFEVLGLNRLVALTDRDHEATQRTAISAGLGFERQVVMDGVVSDLYSISR